MSTPDRRPWWADEPIDGWSLHWHGAHIAELGPDLYGPTELEMFVVGWRGLDLSLQIAATAKGYKCRSITLARQDGSIDYAAFRLTPIEEIITASVEALRLIWPTGAFMWPTAGEGVDELRVAAARDRDVRDTIAVQVHVLASYAGLPAREVVTQALNVSTATASRIIARARQEDRYPDPYEIPRPIAQPDPNVADVLKGVLGYPRAGGVVSSYEKEA